MIGSLPLFHRVRGERVVVVGEGAMGEAKRRLVERAGGVPCPETEAHHAALAFVALEDERDAEAVATRLRRQGLLVNVADRPDLCDFTTPSILDRDPLLIAISTSGASAGLAKHIRLRLERLLPASIGRLAARLSEARSALRSRYPDEDDRRAALDSALGEGGALDPLHERSADRVDAWLGASNETRTAKVETFVLISDDPDDLTIRQTRLLGLADAVWHDERIAPAILDRARADAVRRTLPHNGEPHGLVVRLERS